MTYKEIEGDLIELALAGSFDVIAHGCNCFCTQGAGIAKQMSNIFGTNIIDNEYEEDMINNMLEWHSSEKLGNIDWFNPARDLKVTICPENLTVVNAYTQYKPGANLDYEALTLCLRKMNYAFNNNHIGLPQIGAGIAGGDWEKIKTIIQQELKDCDVTVVIYNK